MPVMPIHIVPDTIPVAALTPVVPIHIVPDTASGRHA
jgi:hypothetical protein